MHWDIFAANLAFIVTAVVVLGGCGWVTAAPFRDRLRYALLTAPLAGLLGVVLLTLVFYSLLKLTLVLSGALAFGTMLAASVIALFLDRPHLGRRELIISLVALLVTGGFAVCWGMAATIKAGGPAIVYWDGTDHLGYAHLADWLKSHRIGALPRADVRVPYESWPALLFQIDPRFGSFTLLALVSAVTGESGTFSYELTLTLVQVVAVLAFAGAFARSPLTLGFLVAGLLTCHWFDYGRTGFFGKTFGFPAAFLVVALILVTLAEAEVRTSRLLALIALSIGAAVAYSGIITAFFFGVIGGGFLLAMGVRTNAPGFRQRFAAWVQKGAMLLLLGTTAIAAGGTVARPLPMGSPDYGVPWPYIFSRIAELDCQGVSLAGFNPGALVTVTWFVLGAWIFLGGLALVWRRKEAIAVLIAPLGLFGILYLLDARAVTFQLIGFFYPFALAGCALLFDTKQEGDTASPAGRPGIGRGMPWVVLGLGVVVIGLHLFRFFGATARYGGAQTPPLALFTKAEVEAVAAFVGRDKVDVDVVHPQLAMVLLVELGRRGSHLQWSAGAWKTLFSYRDWAPPQYNEPGKWRIVAVDTPDIPVDRVAFRSQHYWVLPR